jgi:thiol-disulfide isomerase/thioredoxin
MERVNNTPAAQLGKEVNRQDEVEKRRTNPVGRQAIPLDLEAWVNGAPLTDDDLKGKVVLLDFRAVWCGRCIATFPRLREWNAKYAGKGLVKVGLTRYHNYDWDEKDDKATRSNAKVAPEKE